MSIRWTLLLVCAVLLVILAFAFLYPEKMVSPGPLSTGHSALTTRCFSCHTAWRGATDEQCVACHKLDDIGIRMTTGTPMGPTTVKASFHKELLEQHCLACHSAHRGARPALTGHESFNHKLLRPAIQEKCAECHAAPDNKIHRQIKMPCAQCHEQDHWKPASFEHAALGAQVLTSCEGCHQGPGDELHRQITSGCHQCHDPQRWVPARFDHDKRFRLGEPHNTDCSTCHTNGDYNRYTCYGCHEHTQQSMRAEHREEGVLFSDDCVKCHRGAGENGENSGSAGGRERDD